MSPRTVALLATTCVVGAASIGAGTRVVAITEPAPPAGGHAAVVAQGLVEFDDGPWHWRLDALAVTADQPAQLAGVEAVFVVAEGPGAVLVGGDDGPVARLAAGEALFRPAGATTAVTVAGNPGDVLALAVATGAGTDAFTPGAGTRDVDLVRDVLATNEALILQSDVSVFVVVAEGAVTTGSATLPVGATAALSGNVTLINTSPERAVVFAAVVGPPVGAIGPDIPTATAPPAPTAPPSGDGGGATTQPTPTTEPATTTSTTTTTTTIAEPVDTDSDGLSDTDEAALGTDPNNSDSDGDGIPDGREVNSLGSNPLDTDTDSDGLTDALEIDHSCDINAPDSDGDGLGDAFEANSGFSECSLADTDGDGDDDLAEFSIGTDPRDPNCFSGPGSVCQ